MGGNDCGIALRRDAFNAQQVFWHLSDAKGRTVWPFLDYIIDCVDVEELNAKTVESRAYALLKWYRYLEERSIDMWDVDDATLKGFREALMKRHAANSSNDLQARRRTINLDIRNVYRYYAWLQKDRSYGEGRRLLGASACQITSTLNAANASNGRNCRRYPLTFKHAGERSKHRLGFVPGETHRAQLTEYFFDAYPHHLALRNCLVFEIAWLVGWRRGSILSLTTQDFEPAREHLDDDLIVAPSTQKFGYSNSFTVPNRLVVRIMDFIDTHRLCFAKRPADACTALFINLATGQPLTHIAVSGIFNRARKALGWPKGSGLHAWRRGFTNAFLERELDARIELGLDTSGETIAISVAQVLGQQSLASQSAYVRDAQRRIRGTATYRDKEEHARLSDENARLRSEVATLVRALAAK